MKQLYLLVFCGCLVFGNATFSQAQNESYDSGLAAYRNGNYWTARKDFSEFLEKNKELKDSHPAFYNKVSSAIKHCTYFIQCQGKNPDDGNFELSKPIPDQK